MFADLFPSGRGRPSVPADVIATVMVLASVGGPARIARRSRRCAPICVGRSPPGLSLDDEGFHPTVLTLWRNKLRVSKAPERIFDAVRAVIAETGVLRGKTRRALDSTVLDDAVATQDTVTQLVAMIRRVRKAIPAAAAVEVSAHDYDAGGKPAYAWDDPDARNQLITGLVNDARAVLAVLDGVELDEHEQTAGRVVGADRRSRRGTGSRTEVRARGGSLADRGSSTVRYRVISTSTSRSVEYRDGYMPTSRSNPTPGSSPAAISPRPTPPTAPSGLGCSPAKNRVSTCSPIRPTAPVRSAHNSLSAVTAPSSNRGPSHGTRTWDRTSSAVRTSSSTTTLAP